MSTTPVSVGYESDDCIKNRFTVTVNGVYRISFKLHNHRIDQADLKSRLLKAYNFLLHRRLDRVELYN